MTLKGIAILMTPNVAKHDFKGTYMRTHAIQSQNTTVKNYFTEIQENYWCLSLVLSSLEL